MTLKSSKYYTLTDIDKCRYKQTDLSHDDANNAQC